MAGKVSLRYSAINFLPGRGMNPPVLYFYTNKNTTDYLHLI